MRPSMLVGSLRRAALAQSISGDASSGRRVQVFICFVAVVVEQAQLIAHVEQRNAAEAGDQRVAHENAVNGGIDGGGIVGGECRLKPAERGAGAVGALVAGSGVGLEITAAREAAGKIPGIEIGEEGPVRMAGNANGGCVFVGDRPADVVMAAQIRAPGGIDENLGKMRPQHMGHQPGLAGGERRPELHHEGVMISKVALAARCACLGQDRESGPWVRRSPLPCGSGPARRCGWRRAGPAAADALPARSGSACPCVST